MKRLILLMCIVALFGCSSSIKLTKPGVTESQWYEDYYDCNVQADQAIGYNTAYRTALGNAIASGTERQQSFDSCFKTKGYQRVSVDGY